MDLNQLYFDHQILLMKAESAPAELRKRLEGCASDVAERIGRIQRALGASAARAWEALDTVKVSLPLPGYAL